MTYTFFKLISRTLSLTHVIFRLFMFSRKFMNVCDFQWHVFMVWFGYSHKVKWGHYVFVVLCASLSHSKSWYWWRLVYVFFSLSQIHLRRSCSPLWLCIFPLKTNVNVHVVGRQRTTCSQYILKEKIYCALFFKTLNKKNKILNKNKQQTK